MFRKTEEIVHRFLCLLGCWFKNPDYLEFHKLLEQLKSTHFSHHPDEPVILHREDVINRRRWFKVLQDDRRREEFDNHLLDVVDKAIFTLVGVVIDKKTLREKYGQEAAHPYHLAMGFMLQRYAGYLNHINRVGDTMAESRGRIEDHLLAESYSAIYQRGTWKTGASFFQGALSSWELKLKQKSANIAGLQLADMLGHPVKQYILWRYGFIPENELGKFGRRLLPIIEAKFNRHLYEGRIEGYGYVLYPK